MLRVIFAWNDNDDEKPKTRDPTKAKEDFMIQGRSESWNERENV